MTLEDLANTRRNNQRPKSMILLSMVGPLAFCNPVIEVNQPYHDQDFRPLLDLDIEIVHAHETQPQQVVRLIDQVLQAKPKTLNAWNAKTGVLTTVIDHDKKSFFNYQTQNYANSTRQHH